jgi:hypothetical protein
MFNKKKRYDWQMLPVAICRVAAITLMVLGAAELADYNSSVENQNKAIVESLTMPAVVDRIRVFRHNSLEHAAETSGDMQLDASIQQDVARITNSVAFAELAARHVSDRKTYSEFALFEANAFKKSLSHVSADQLEESNLLTTMSYICMHANGTALVATHIVLSKIKLGAGLIILGLFALMITLLPTVYRSRLANKIYAKDWYSTAQ